MTHDEAVSLIRKTRLVAIMRGMPVERALDAARALYRGGVRVLEYTFDHTDPQSVAHTCERVRRVREALGEDVLIGCGTVLTREEVERGIAAGARLMISPSVDAEIIRLTREQGAVSMPGALTPTEIVAAHNAGADFVKLFPAGVLGVAYIRAVRAPLAHIPMTAVGGVRPENVAAFLSAGVAGFGVGGELVRKELIDAEDWDGLTARALEFTRAIAAWEAEHA